MDSDTDTEGLGQIADHGIRSAGSHLEVPLHAAGLVDQTHEVMVTGA